MSSYHDTKAQATNTSHSPRTETESDSATHSHAIPTTDAESRSSTNSRTEVIEW
ncbi:hypothetical protein [Baaleninema simplex]|uniref:hypothetical protein n=1 Tax=Baaleninema simplex TaxID=2862350 RepID=UPI001C554381|nr:hypothetical protein [Baaleninema simplex]